MTGSATSLAIAFLLLTIVAQAFEPVPADFTEFHNGRLTDTLSVGDYSTGAYFTESYTQTERLVRSTEVRTRSVASDQCCGGGLEATIHSSFIGSAHIAWASVSPVTGDGGRHQEYGRSIEDLTGVFTIDKFIQFWGNSTCGEISVDWMPCI